MVRRSALTSALLCFATALRVPQAWALTPEDHASDMAFAIERLLRT